MANNENLRGPRQLTHEQAVEMGRKGGIASGEAKRRRKTLKQGLEALLTAPVTAVKDKNKLKAMGVPVEDMDAEQLMNLALLKKAISGDVKAFEVIRSVLGEDMRLPPGASLEADGLFEAIAKAVRPRDV